MALVARIHERIVNMMDLWKPSTLPGHGQFLLIIHLMWHTACVRICVPLRVTVVQPVSLVHQYSRNRTQQHYLTLGYRCRRCSQYCHCHLNNRTYYENTTVKIVNAQFVHTQTALTSMAFSMHFTGQHSWRQLLRMESFLASSSSSSFSFHSLSNASPNIQRHTKIT